MVTRLRTSFGCGPIDGSKITDEDVSVSWNIVQDTFGQAAVKRLSGIVKQVSSMTPVNQVRVAAAKADSVALALQDQDGVELAQLVAAPGRVHRAADTSPVAKLYESIDKVNMIQCWERSHESCQKQPERVRSFFAAKGFSMGRGQSLSNCLCKYVCKMLEMSNTKTYWYYTALTSLKVATLDGDLLI